MSLLVEPDRLLEIARMFPFIEGVSEGGTEPCCEFVDAATHRPACDLSAEWALRARCCGAMCLGCGPHVEQLMDPNFAPVVLACLRCGTHHGSDREMFTCTRL